MGIAVAIYAVLLGIFLLMAILILRHTVKFGYLSPKFKTIVSIFGLLSLGVIILSFYFVLNLFQGDSKAPTFDTPSSDVELNF